MNLSDKTKAGMVLGATALVSVGLGAGVYAM
jgi:hypothetical protein